MSCSRELVTGSGSITFAHPTTQQQLLVWRDRPRTVMVIKKLGRELNKQFYEVRVYVRVMCCVCCAQEEEEFVCCVLCAAAAAAAAAAARAQH